MENVVLNLEKRELGTKGKLNEYRRAGKIPGILYGPHEKPTPVVVEEKQIRLALTSGHTLFEAKLGRAKKRVVIREVQRHPVRGDLLHVDFYAVTTGEKLTVTVPVVLVGTARGVKDQGGTLLHELHEVEIECLPKDLPEKIEVDVTNLGVGDSIHVHDLQMEGVTFLTPGDAVIAHIAAPKVAVEVEAAPTAPGEAVETTPSEAEEEEE